MISTQRNQISVTLTLGTDPYLQRLPSALLQRGMLRRVLRLGPNLAVLDPNGEGSLKVSKAFPEFKVASRLVWGVWRRLPSLGRSHFPIVVTAWLADRLLSSHIPKSTIFEGMPAVCLACLRAAKRHHAMTTIQNSLVHPRHWQREAVAECEHFGIGLRRSNSVLPLPLIRRMEREYELCDKIIVLSSFARRSFQEFGHERNVVTVWPGVDHHFFTPAEEPGRDEVFRICFVGRVELTKGIGYLLMAWKRLALPNAELVLVGENYPETNTLFTQYASGNVRLLGHLTPHEVLKQYQVSNLLVLPSVQEGFGLVLLEAMAVGIPVIATEQSGGADCVNEGQNGFVVPARNVDALADAILWCFRHRDQLVSMGKAARTKVEQVFTLSHYEERQIAFYRSLAPQPCEPAHPR